MGELNDVMLSHGFKVKGRVALEGTKPSIDTLPTEYNTPAGFKLMGGTSDVMAVKFKRKPAYKYRWNVKNGNGQPLTFVWSGNKFYLKTKSGFSHLTLLTLPMQSFEGLIDALDTYLLDKHIRPL